MVSFLHFENNEPHAHHFQYHYRHRLHLPSKLVKRDLHTHCHFAEPPPLRIRQSIHHSRFQPTLYLFANTQLHLNYRQHHNHLVPLTYYTYLHHLLEPRLCELFVRPMQSQPLHHWSPTPQVPIPHGRSPPLIVTHLAKTGLTMQVAPHAEPHHRLLWVKLNLQESSQH